MVTDLELAIQAYKMNREALTRKLNVITKLTQDVVFLSQELEDSIVRVDECLSRTEEEAGDQVKVHKTV